MTDRTHSPPVLLAVRETMGELAMKNEHDFKAALEDYNSWYEDTAGGGDLAEYLDVCGLEAVEVALRLADRLQSGEVSEDMREEGYAANIGPAGTFQAMAAQMMKELEDGRE